MLLPISRRKPIVSTAVRILTRVLQVETILPDPVLKAPYGLLPKEFVVIARSLNGLPTPIENEYEYQ